MRRTVYLLVTIELDTDDDRGADEVRADIERELCGDLADVVLLTHTHDEDNPAAPPSAQPDGRQQREDAAARERTAYLAAVMRAVMRHDPALEPYLSPICPECDQIPEPEDGDHVVLGALVVIGCEGYRVINPNVVGISRPTWQPQD